MKTETSNTQHPTSAFAQTLRRDKSNIEVPRRYDAGSVSFDGPCSMSVRRPRVRRLARCASANLQSSIFNIQSPRPRRSGFTLLELMLAIAILAVISTLAYMSFSAVVSAWKRGMVLSDDLHHGDFVMEQLVMAMRSAYYPDARDKGGAYGMITEDVGSGESARDTISWVKLGGALVGKDSQMAGSPHRVKVSIENNEEGKPAVAVWAWRLYGQPDTFDPSAVKPTFLSTRVVGFNCRTAYRKTGDEIDWLDEWEETNRLPTVVELTLYLEPLDRNEPPVEVKRVFGIPVAPLSW